MEKLRRQHGERRKSLGLKGPHRTFNLTNIIGVPALDVDVWPQERPDPHPIAGWEILVFDPGEMAGWASLVSEGVYANSRLVTEYRHIQVGQGAWHEVLKWSNNFARCERIYVEETPHAAIRTYDLWPVRFEGAVRHAVYPSEPDSVWPTNLKVVKKWFKLPRGHGLGPHAQSALAHLVGVMVRDGAKKR